MYPPGVLLVILNVMLDRVSAYPDEISVPRLYVQIQQIEDNAVREIAKTSIVDK